MWPRRTALAALLIAGIAACTDSLRSAGPNPATAENHADQLFDAFASRWNQVDVSPKYEIARVRLAQSALVPSRIFGDSAVWESRSSPTLRTLLVSGTTVDGRYHLDTRPSFTPTIRPGDTRHTISLEQVTPSAYRWDTKVDMAVGSISADEMSLLISTLLGAAEGRGERELRDDYRAAVPRAMAAFGRGFSIDSLHVTPGALGTTSVVIVSGFHPELMTPAYPALAGYLDKYLGPAKYHFAIADRSGVALFDVLGRDRTITVRYRLQQLKLTSLFGPPRAWSDSLVLTADATLKVKHFTVGFHSLVTDFVISNTGRDRAWTVIAQREPKWDLPFITERLIRSPLHRPFDGAGAMLRFGIRDSAGTQSVFSRRTRLDVEESTIMRWLGSLASHAVGDLDAKVEVEEDRFLRDGFVALQADIHALVPRWK
ncbi:MAG: hypothetical protein ABJF01_13380 [bacterium]